MRLGASWIRRFEPEDGCPLFLFPFVTTLTIDICLGGSET
jgi:hypothetical protein